MSRRNAIWLVAIVAVGVVVGWIAGVVWGLVAGGTVLVVSEVVERVARMRRRAEKHAADASDGVG